MELQCIIALAMYYFVYFEFVFPQLQCDMPQKMAKSDGAFQVIVDEARSREGGDIFSNSKENKIIVLTTAELLPSIRVCVSLLLCVYVS